MGKNSIQAPFLKGRSKVILVIGSIFLSLVATEALSRWFLWKSRHTYGPKIHDYFYFDRNGVFRIKPNSRGWHMGQDNPIMVEINSEGFRGPELKASPAKRIIFIGDSVVFNGYVQEKETFTAHLEGQFRKDGHKVEVINAGTTDVGVKQYLLQARHNRFDRYKADLIIIGLYLNDSRPPQGFLGEDQDQLFNFLRHSPLRHLALTHYIKQAYVAWRTKRGDIYSERFNWIARFNSGMWKDDLEQFQRTVAEARFDWGAAWYPSFKKLVYPALMEIRDLYVGKGAKLAVVLFPVSLQVHTSLTDPIIDYPQRQLSMFTKRENVPFLDLLPFMRGDKKRRLFLDTAHLSRKGNQKVANIIYPFLKDILGKKIWKSIAH